MKFPPSGISKEIEIGCPLLPPVAVAVGRGFVEEPVAVVEVDVPVLAVLVVADVEVEVDEDVVEEDDAVEVVETPPGAPDICPT